MSVEVSVERLDPLENKELQSDGYVTLSQYESVMQDPEGTQGSEYAKLMDKLPSSYIKKSHFTSVSSRKTASMHESTAHACILINADAQSQDPF